MIFPSFSVTPVVYYKYNIYYVRFWSFRRKVIESTGFEPVPFVPNDTVTFVEWSMVHPYFRSASYHMLGDVLPN